MHATPQSRANHCAHALVSLITHLEKMFEGLPRGWHDADIALSQDPPVLLWPFLQKTHALETAHQRLDFESRKGRLDERLATFHASVLDHPTFGSYLTDHPTKRVHLRWKKDEVVLEFADWRACHYQAPWTPVQTTVARIRSLTRAHTVSPDIPLAIFQSPHKKSFLGGAHAAPQSFQDLAPFLLKDPTPHTILWRFVPIEHTLYNHDVLVFNLANGSFSEMPKFTQHDTTLQKGVLTFAKKMNARLAIPDAQLQAL